MANDQEVQEFVSWYEMRVLRKRGRPASPKTLRAKACRLRACLAAAGAPDCVALATSIQDRESVECILDALLARMSSGAAAAAFYTLQDFAAYARAKGWATGSALLESDRPPSNPQKVILCYPPEALQRLLTVSWGKGLRWAAFVHTLALTGRRVGEILSLEWDWLNLSAEVPHFSLPLTKNGTQQYVPLNTTLQEVFSEQNVKEMRYAPQGRAGRDPEQFVFPWTHSSASKVFARYCATVGVEDLGFHAFRHTRATELLARGVPIQAVAALLGHSAVATTDRIYNHATALSYARYTE